MKICSQFLKKIFVEILPTFKHSLDLEYLFLCSSEKIIYLFILLGRNCCACFCLCCKLASLFFNSQVILGSQYPFFYFISFVISAVVFCRGRTKLLLLLLLLLLIIQSYIFIGACFCALWKVLFKNKLHSVYLTRVTLNSLLRLIYLWPSDSGSNWN